MTRDLMDLEFTGRSGFGGEISTPRKINGWNLRRNTCKDEENHFPKHHFQVLCHVNLWGRIFTKRGGVNQKAPVSCVGEHKCLTFFGGF